MREETRTFEVRYIAFDVGERVRNIHSWGPLKPGTYVVKAFYPPLFSTDEAHVDVEGHPYMVRVKLITTAEIVSYFDQDGHLEWGYLVDSENKLVERDGVLVKATEIMDPWPRPVVNLVAGATMDPWTARMDGELAALQVKKGQ